MTSDQRKFSNLKLKELGTICFRNNVKLKVIGAGNIKINSNIFIKKVLYVENLRFNLLIIS